MDLPIDSPEAAVEAVAETTLATGPVAALRISEIRIQDVRVLQDLCLELGDLTVLVGENNVGKTTVLRALDLAFGAARPDIDDFRVDALGVRANAFVIDIKLSPAAGGEFDDTIAGRLGTAVQLAEPQFATLRLRGTATADGSGPVLERRWVAGWACDRTVATALQELERPRAEQLKLISFFLLDARRDLVEELRQRRSYWGRLLADVGIPAVEKAALEASIAALGKDVVDKSSVLAGLRTELEQVKKALGSAVTEISIEALPARIDEVARAVDILLRAPGSAALPLRLQGMGSRSLAVVMVFQAFAKLRLGLGHDIGPHAVAAFEEPEAHLHPHPQRAIFNSIAELPGQKIISTHSPFITQVANLFDLRVLTRVDATITCRSVPQAQPDGSQTFTPDQLAKLQRFVQRNNGEALFARCVVLHEGETELGAVPVFARSLWNADPAGRGVSMVSVGGAQTFQHYVKVLDYLRVSWVILVDGDPAGQQGMISAEAALGRTFAPGECFMLPSGTDFETHLVAAGHSTEMLAAAAAHHGQGEVDQYRAINHGGASRGGGVRDYQTAGWEERLAADFCKSHMKSVSGGEAIAEHLLAKLDAGGQPTIPPEIRALLERVDVLVKDGP